MFVKTPATQPQHNEPTPTPEETAEELWKRDAVYDGRRAQEWGSLELFTAYVKGNEARRISIYHGMAT